MAGGLTHFDEQGHARMVDVGEKAETDRVAVAHGRIYVKEEVYRAITEGTAKKGDVLGVARVAGIMGAKRTSDLIPLCHVLLLTKCSVDFVLHEEERAVEAVCTVKTHGKTGVEMEALTGASVALLTIYDMCKAMDRGMTMTGICLLKKDGGKSGLYERPAEGAVAGSVSCGDPEEGAAAGSVSCGRPMEGAVAGSVSCGGPAGGAAAGSVSCGHLAEETTAERSGYDRSTGKDD